MAGPGPPDPRVRLVFSLRALKDLEALSDAEALRLLREAARATGGPLPHGAAGVPALVVVQVEGGRARYLLEYGGGERT